MPTIDPTPMSTNAPAPSPDPSAEAFTWRAHPAREHVGRTFGALLVMAALAVAVAFTAQSAIWGVGSFVLLILFLNRYFLPSRFEMDAEGITARFPLVRRRLEWRDVHQVVTGRLGAWLSPRRRPSFYDPRGVQVLYGPERDAVVSRMRVWASDVTATGDPA